MVQAKCAGCDDEPQLQRQADAEEESEPLQLMPMVQRKCAACREQDDKPLQRRNVEEDEAVQGKAGTDAHAADGAHVHGTCTACREEDRGLQAKLTIGAPGDRYEQEADRTADAVMRTASTDPVGDTRTSRGVIQPLSQEVARPAVLQRDAAETCSVGDEPKEAGEEDEETEDQDPESATTVSPKRSPGVISPPPDLETRIDRLRGTGSALPRATRDFMESRFGYDFSGVRVHTGSSSEHLNRDVKSLAFTTGSDIYFGTGQYRPETDAGKHLLAHELTHVVQQTGTGASGGAVREKADPTLISRKDDGKPEEKPYYRSHYVSGTATHAVIERLLRAEDADLVTEAAIPGADRKAAFVNLIGVADLYKSTPTRTVSGVKAYKDASEDQHIVSMNKPSLVGTRPAVTSSPTRPPRKKGVRGWSGNFPEAIEIGEIKPANTSMSVAGAKQLFNYTHGYKEFVEKVHKVSGGKTRPSINVSRLVLKIPAYLDFDQWASQHSVSSRKSEYGDRRLWIASVGHGVYLYTDFDKDLKSAPPEDFTKHLGEVRKLQDRIAGQQHPRTARMKFASSNARVDLSRLSRVGTSLRRVQRNTKDRPANYWRDMGVAWEKDRQAFATPFRASLKTTLKGFREKIRFEKRLGRAGRSPKAVEKKEIKEYKSLMFWSGRAGKLLGRVRFLLGTAWDKVVGVFEKMKTKMGGLRDKVKGLKETGLVKMGWASRLIQVVVAACKVAFSSFITESFNFFADCFHSAIDKLLDQLKGELHAAFGERICRYRKLFEESKEKLETEWGEAIKQIEALVAAVQDVKRWTDIATASISLIRVGVQIISCVSPPALGCLWGLVAQLGIGAMLGLVIGTQWFADEIITPNVRELVRTHIAPHYQKMINRVLGDGLSEYHCKVADDAIPSMQFTAKATIPESALRAHRDSWESEFEPQLLKDLQEVFGKPGGKKPTKEELLALVKKIQESKLSMQDLKDRKTMQALLQQSLNPRTGKLDLEDAKKQAEKTEPPAPVVKERTIDYPWARQQNAVFQKMRGWDPTLFVKKPDIKVDTDEFADAVYDMQEALKIKADGILGDDTVIAFYEKNKKKKDIFYKQSLQANEERKRAAEERKKEKEAKDKGGVEKGAKDKAEAPPALPPSVKVLDAHALVPDDRNEMNPGGIGVFIVNVWSFVHRKDRNFEATSSPKFISLDVYVSKKHEYRIENVAVKELYPTKMFGDACYWTLVLKLEDGIQLQTSKGKFVTFYLDWCLSVDPL